MSKTRSVFRNIGYGLILKPVSILISFVLVPITVSFLGDFSYGLWATILSIVSWIGFFDIGIGNGLRNHLTKAISSNDYVNARKLIATAYLVITVISFLVLAILILLIQMIDWRTLLKVQFYDISEIRYILLVNFVFICLNFIFRLITTIYYSMQQASATGLMQILNQLLNFFGVLLLTFFSFDKTLLGISVIYGVSALLTNIIFTIIFFLNNKKLRSEERRVG